MKGRISLKDFILGVKQELIVAAEEGSKAPFFELKEVELKAKFSLEIEAGVEGGPLGLFLKLTGGTKTEQVHEVVIKFAPISIEELPSGDSSGGTRMGLPKTRRAKSVVVVQEVAQKRSGPRMEKNLKASIISKRQPKTAKSKKITMSE
jgi:hypothetical protein